MKLTRGKGTPEEGGCWMVAVQQYTEKFGWHDQPACVDPVIRGLCISLNDMCEDGEREALIGPHLFAPVGTANPALLPERLSRVVRFAMTCAESNKSDHAASWASDTYTAYLAYSACSQDFESKLHAYDAARYAAETTRYDDNKNDAKQRILALILELCEMSTPTERGVTGVRSKQQVLALVCKQQECS